VVGRESDVGSQVQTENRPFDGVSADVKDRERTVWISFGSNTAEHMTHGIHRAAAIRTLAAAAGAGTVLEVEDGDGTRTLLELSAEGYSLPAR
jgi:hypothetical protein